MKFFGKRQKAISKGLARLQQAFQQTVRSSRQVYHVDTPGSDVGETSSTGGLSFAAAIQQHDQYAGVIEQAAAVHHHVTLERRSTGRSSASEPDARNDLQTLESKF